MAIAGNGDRDVRSDAERTRGVAGLALRGTVIGGDVTNQTETAPRAVAQERATKTHAPSADDALHGEAGLDSVRRALQLLKALQDGESLAVKQASELLGVAPASAHRLLTTLKLEGFATQTGDRRYRAGTQLSPLKPRPMTRADFKATVWPVISELRERTGETIHVWTRRGSLLYLLHSVPGSAGGSVPHDALSRIPAYTTASGRALLAELPNEQVQSIHKQGFIPWRDAKITSISALKRRLSSIRRDGYEVTVEEAIQGTSGLGICIHDPWHRPMLGLGLAVPNRRFERSNVARLSEALEDSRVQAEKELTRFHVEQQFFGED